MSLPTRRTTTRRSAPAAALALALTLAACSTPGAEPEPPSGTGAQTAPAGPQADSKQTRLTGEDVQQDRERFLALDDQLRGEFAAFDDDARLGPVLLSLHVCSVLYADHDHDRDVQQRYQELLDDYSGDGFLSSETGEHWVDFSVHELCPDLEPQLAR